MTLYTVLDAKPLADLMIDPADAHYGRLRELCAQHYRDGRGWEPALHSPEREQALRLAEGVLSGHEPKFGWLSVSQECTGTTDPFFALAARPFIGQAEGWDQRAYDALRRSFEHYRGQLLHPDDQPLDGITYSDQSA